MESVDDEWDQDPDKLDLEDLLFVTYDPSKIDHQRLLETIKKEGFEAEGR